MRKPIAVSTLLEPQNLWYCVICDDGSIWLRAAGEEDGKWNRLPDIPQDEGQS